MASTAAAPVQLAPAPLSGRSRRGSGEGGPVGPAAERAAAAVLHACVDCRRLPEAPADPAEREDGVEYRPKSPRPLAAGGGPRSGRCTTHKRATKRKRSATQRATHKTRRFRLSAGLQLALWIAQGSSCPCGRKAAPEVPPGVTLDHDHDAACIARGEHPEDEGCPECVTGFLCVHCNVEVIGRLEGSLKTRARVAAGLAALAAHLTDPPLARLRRERPELFDETATHSPVLERSA